MFVGFPEVNSRSLFYLDVDTNFPDTCGNDIISDGCPHRDALEFVQVLRPSPVLVVVVLQRAREHRVRPEGEESVGPLRGEGDEVRVYYPVDPVTFRALEGEKASLATAFSICGRTKTVNISE